MTRPAPHTTHGSRIVIVRTAERALHACTCMHGIEGIECMQLGDLHLAGMRCALCPHTLRGDVRSLLAVLGKEEST